MKEFGLIGRHVAHSFSANYFNNKFEEEGIDAIYRLYDLEKIEDLQEILDSSKDLKGFNVTSPYKRDVMRFVNSLSSAAREIGAVNVVSINRTNERVELIGDNTDYEGFRMTLESLPIVPSKSKALILGNGGASAAVRYALTQYEISCSVVSRKNIVGAISYQEANDSLSNFELIINATPLGMETLINEAPLIDYNKITKKHILYDLIYNPAETLFLKKGREKGALTINGSAMLINQAILSWDIWNR